MVLELCDEPILLVNDSLTGLPLDFNVLC
jgi:hypothetical protein